MNAAILACFCVGLLAVLFCIATGLHRIAAALEKKP